MSDDPVTPPFAAAHACDAAKDTLSDLLAGLRTGTALNRARLPIVAAALLAFELAVLLLFIAISHHWIGPPNRPTTTDFASFYAAGTLADSGHPNLAYDLTAHRAAEEHATESGIIYQYFYYPPVYLFICAALAPLPYLLAFVVFQVVTLPLYLLVGQRILEERTLTTLLILLSFPAVFWNVGLGQNAFLTAALFGSGLLLIDRRPALAGLLFGLLCYKPHFGLLIPVTLAAGGHWRAFVSATVTAAVLVVLSVICFGWQSWHDYATLFAGSNATYGSGYIDLSAFITPFGAVRFLGAGNGVAYAIQAVATLCAVALVIWIWRKQATLPLRAASLIAATLIAVPVALIYDDMLLMIAIAWLVRAARTSGFMAWEKLTLSICFGIPLIARGCSTITHIPFALLASTALLVLVAIRARDQAVGVQAAVI